MAIALMGSEITRRKHFGGENQIKSESENSPKLPWRGKHARRRHEITRQTPFGGEIRHDFAANALFYFSAFGIHLQILDVQEVLRGLGHTSEQGRLFLERTVDDRGSVRKLSFEIPFEDLD